jgi:hypothetical protein
MKSPAFVPGFLLSGRSIFLITQSFPEMTVEGRSGRFNTPINYLPPPGFFTLRGEGGAAI